MSQAPNLYLEFAVVNFSFFFTHITNARSNSCLYIVVIQSSYHPYNNIELTVNILLTDHCQLIVREIADINVIHLPNPAPPRLQVHTHILTQHFNIFMNRQMHWTFAKKKIKRRTNSNKEC